MAGNRRTDTERRRRRLRFGSVLALLALLLQNGLALEYPVMAAGVHGARMAGSMWDSGRSSSDHHAAATHEHEEKKQPSHPKPVCPVCQALQYIGVFLTPTAAGPVALPYVHKAAPATPVPDRPHVAFLSAHRPRAPPIAA